MTEELESPYLGFGLTRKRDGQVMCCICFKYRLPQELATEIEDGVIVIWDVCKGLCAQAAGINEQ